MLYSTAETPVFTSDHAPVFKAALPESFINFHRTFEPEENTKTFPARTVILFE